MIGVMTRTADEKFGLEVKAIREGNGWSMSTLAARLSKAGLTNFHPNTIGRLERGERAIRLSEAVIVAQVLGVSLDDLVVDPMVGDEEIRNCMELMDEACQDIAVASEREAPRRHLLEVEIERAERKLHDGEILPEHVGQVREACEAGRALLAEDRVEYWRNRLAEIEDPESGRPWGPAIENRQFRKLRFKYGER